MGRHDPAIAAALQRIRARSRLSQAEVAQRMRTTQTAIARLESGRLNPSLQTLRNYASANGYCLEVNFVAGQASGEGTGAIVVVDSGPGASLAP